MDSGWAQIISALIMIIFGGSSWVGAVIVQRRTRREVREVGRDAALVREQVKNSHNTNLREEQDTRHEQVMRKLSTIESTQRIHGRSIERLTDDVSRLADADLEQSRQAARDRARVDRLTERQKENRNGNNNSGQH